MTRVRKNARELHTKTESVKRVQTPPETAVENVATGRTLIATPDTDCIPENIQTALENGVLKDSETAYTVYTGEHRPLPYEGAEFDTVIGLMGKADLYSRAKPFHECTRVVKQGGNIRYFAGWVPHSDRATLSGISLADTLEYRAILGEDPDNFNAEKGHMDIVYVSDWTVNPGQTGLEQFATES